MSESISAEELQGEESGQDSESPSSPRDLESDSPHKAEGIGERVSSINCPDSPASAVLSSRELWQLFDAIGTEMIVTRRGRRMFPAIKVELYDLKPDVSYILLMDMAPVDKYRYKYSAGWVRCFEEECAPTRLYIHPDSPALGSHWTSVVINFYKLKLTNNQLDKQGHIIVNSMHRYQPRLHIVESDDINSFNWETRQTFIFPETQFTTVTAYQNDKITQLKIKTNPFAKGFRTPFSRCRSRNPPGVCARFPLRSNSCSDSGVEDPPHPSPTSLPHSSPTSLFSPKFLLPTHDSSHVLLHDSARVLVQGQEMAAPRVLLPGWDLQQLVIPEQEGQQKVLFTDTEGNPILVQNGKTHLLAGQQDSHKLLVAGHNYQKFVFPTANKFFSPQQEAQVMRLVVAPDGQKLLLPPQAPRQEIQVGKNFVLQTQDVQKMMNGQTLLFAGTQDTQQVIMVGPSDKSGATAGKRRRPAEDIPAARKLPCLSVSATQTAQESQVVLMYRPVVASQGTPQLLPTALLQPNSSRASASTAYTVMTSPQELGTQSTPLPQVSTTHPITTTSLVRTSSPHILTSVTTSHPSPSPSPSTPTVVNGLVHLRPAEIKKIVSPSPDMNKPPVDISCLTREGVVRSKTPPALLQVQSSKQSDPHSQQSTHKQQEPTEPESGEQQQQAQPAARQDVVLVQAAPSTGMQRVVVIGEKGEVAQQPQMVLPVAYDQQLVSMPIYRVGSSLRGLQPLQVLASLPSGGTAT